MSTEGNCAISGRRDLRLWVLAVLDFALAASLVYTSLPWLLERSYANRVDWEVARVGAAIAAIGLGAAVCGAGLILGPRRKLLAQKWARPAYIVYHCMLAPGIAALIVFANALFLLPALNSPYGLLPPANLFPLSLLSGAGIYYLTAGRGAFYFNKIPILGGRSG